MTPCDPTRTGGRCVLPAAEGVATPAGMQAAGVHIISGHGRGCAHVWVGNEAIAATVLVFNPLELLLVRYRSTASDDARGAAATNIGGVGIVASRERE